MSVRRAAPAAAPSNRKRLDVVLRAGLERRDAECNNPARSEAERRLSPNATGALLVPTNPGAPGAPGQMFIPTPVPSVTDPGKPWRDADLPVPGIYEDREKFGPARYNRLPENLPVTVDDYSNNLYFTKGSGQGAELKKMETGPDASVLGDLYFDGPSGNEYLTAWLPKSYRYGGSPGSAELERRLWQKGVEFITFSGKTLASQTINEFQLKLSTAVKMGEDLPPPLSGSSAAEALIVTEAGLEASLWELDAVARGLGLGEIGKYDYGAVTARLDAVDGLSFSYKNLEYFPNQEFQGAFFLSSNLGPTVVQQRRGGTIVYTRAWNGDLKIDAGRSPGMDKTVPETIPYKTILQHEAEEAERRKQEAAENAKLGNELRSEQQKAFGEIIVFVGSSLALALYTLLTAAKRAMTKSQAGDAQAVQSVEPRAEDQPTEEEMAAVRAERERLKVQRRALLSAARARPKTREAEEELQKLLAIVMPGSTALRL